VTHVREFISGIDSPSLCDNCARENAQIVIENFLQYGKHRCLCQDCAALALTEHPKLMAGVVISLILSSGK
jgi:hypothetical protein